MANVANRKKEKKKKKKRGFIVRKLFLRKKSGQKRSYLLFLGLITLGVGVLVSLLLNKKKKTEKKTKKDKRQDKKKKDGAAGTGAAAGAGKKKGRQKGKTEKAGKTEKKSSKGKSGKSGKGAKTGAGKSLTKKPFKLQKVDFFIIAAITAGIGLLVYPSIGDLYSRWKTMQSVNEYDKIVDEMDDQEIEDEIERARRYNRTLWGTRYLGIGADEPDGSNPMKEGDEEYNDILNVTKNGVMGYIIIDKIDSYSTVYHGSTESVLAAGVGHLFTTGFMVDGPNVHGAISAHTGLVSATLFTDLDQLEIGDSFEIHILNRVYTYQIDQIRIVDPSDLSDLQIEYGSNLVTLITCYPYGINSHRLLVRGRLQGYNYNKEDYEEYIEEEEQSGEEEKKNPQQISDWEAENNTEQLTQTGTRWWDILRLAMLGGVIAVMEALFYLHFRGKGDGTYRIQRKLCVIIMIPGILLILMAGFRSIQALLQEYTAGKECEQQMQDLGAYLEEYVTVEEETDSGETESSHVDSDTEEDGENQENTEDEKPENPVVTIGEYSYIGKLSLPSLDMELPVMAECTEENLALAPCVDTGTIEGKNLVIAGHRYRKLFSNLVKLQPGDKIYLTSAENRLYTYEVKSCTEIIPRKQDLYYGYDNWDIALYTCSASGENRYVVYGKLIEN